MIFLRKDSELLCLTFHEIITSWQCTKQTYAYHDKLIGVVEHACLKIASVSTVFWRNIHQLRLHLYKLIQIIYDALIDTWESIHIRPPGPHNNCQFSKNCYIGWIKRIFLHNKKKRLCARIYVQTSLWHWSIDQS